MISKKGLRTETLATVIQDIILGIIQSRTEENGQRRNWRGHLSVVDAALQSAKKNVLCGRLPQPRRTILGKSDHGGHHRGLGADLESQDGP